MKYFEKIITIIGYSLLASGLVALCMEAAFFAWDTPAIRQTIILATTVQPETFTELYFDNYTALPVTTVPHKSYSFAFTIHNVENRDMTYSFVVVLQSNKKTQIINKNILFLRNNDAKTINETFSASDSSHQSELVVTLLNKKQQIDFWINKK